MPVCSWAPAYFRGPGQNPDLELIPLELFSSALRWLSRQPEVDPSGLGILGGSKGAEAALLVAVRHPELKAVIAALPSSVVWPGIIAEARPGPIAGRVLPGGANEPSALAFGAFQQPFDFVDISLHLRDARELNLQIASQVLHLRRDARYFTARRVVSDGLQWQHIAPRQVTMGRREIHAHQLIAGSGKPRSAFCRTGPAGNLVFHVAQNRFCSFE